MKNIKDARVLGKNEKRMLKGGNTVCTWSCSTTGVVYNLQHHCLASCPGGLCIRSKNC